jgi:zinc protease
MNNNQRSSIPNSENIVRQEFPNGITALVYENFASPIVSVRGLLPVGALEEPADKTGLASFTAACLMRGAADLTFQQIYERIEAVGAAVGIHGGSYSTHFNAKCLAEDLPLVLNTLATVLRSPTFPSAEVEKERGEILTGLEERKDSPDVMAHLKFRELLYGRDHVYGRSHDGYLDTIPRISRDDLANFYQAHYGPGGMIFTIAGAVSAAEVLQMIQAEFGDWNPVQRRAENSRPIPAVSRPHEIRQTRISMPEKVQCELVLGFIGPSRRDPDYLEAALGNVILGQFGLYGRLGEVIREKQGLAYYCYSYLDNRVGPGAWQVVAGLHPTNIDRTVESVRLELRRLQEEIVGAEEFANNKVYVTGTLPLHLETNGGIASNVLNMEFHGLGLDYLAQYADRINRITPQEIQAIARKYFDPDAYTLAVAGPV